MFGFDARTRAILQAIERNGSVAAAARELGLDASNTRRHLATAAARRGAPLLTSARGGDARGKSRLTRAGRAMARDTAGWPGRAGDYDTENGVTPIDVGARTLVAAGRVPHGPVRVTVRAEDVTLERASATRTSARNAWPCEVRALVAKTEGTWRVELVAGDIRLAALLTRGAVRDLRLREGSRVVARFKATVVRATAM